MVSFPTRPSTAIVCPVKLIACCCPNLTSEFPLGFDWVETDGFGVEVEAFEPFVILVHTWLPSLRIKSPLSKYASLVKYFESVSIVAPTALQAALRVEVVLDLLKFFNVEIPIL